MDLVALRVGNDPKRGYSNFPRINLAPVTVEASSGINVSHGRILWGVCTSAHNVHSSGTMKLGHSLRVHRVNRAGESERKTVLLSDLKGSERNQNQIAKKQEEEKHATGPL